MKRTLVSVLLTAAFLLSATAPAFASETETPGGDERPASTIETSAYEGSGEEETSDSEILFSEPNSETPDDDVSAEDDSAEASGEGTVEETPLQDPDATTAVEGTAEIANPDTDTESDDVMDAENVAIDPEPGESENVTGNPEIVVEDTEEEQEDAENAAIDPEPDEAETSETDADDAEDEEVEMAGLFSAGQVLYTDESGAVVSVTVSDTNPLILNPYQMDVVQNDTTYQDVIVHEPQTISSRSNVPVSINAQLNVSAASGSQLTLVSSPNDFSDASNAGPQLFLWMEFQSVPSGGQPTWTGRYTGASNQLVANAQSAQVLTLNPPTGRSSTQAMFRAYGVFHIPDGKMINVSDGITVSMNFKFTPGEVQLFGFVEDEEPEAMPEAEPFTEDTATVSPSEDVAAFDEAEAVEGADDVTVPDEAQAVEGADDVAVPDEAQAVEGADDVTEPEEALAVEATDDVAEPEEALAAEDADDVAVPDEAQAVEGADDANAVSEPDSMGMRAFINAQAVEDTDDAVTESDMRAFTDTVSGDAHDAVAESGMQAFTGTVSNDAHDADAVAKSDMQAFTDTVSGDARNADADAKSNMKAFTDTVSVQSTDTGSFSGFSPIGN